MGGESDADGRRETVAHRIEFLELLEAEGPMPPRDVVDALEYSRGTVTRALRELREAALVERREEGYGTKLAGTMAAAEYRRYERASRAILSADSLLEPIPSADAPPVEVLVGADTILAEEELPVRALEAVSERVRSADGVRAYLPTLVNTHLLRVWHRTVVATPADDLAIFDPDLLTVLKGQYPHLLAEMAAAPGFTAFATSGPPYGVVLTETDETATVAVVVYAADTAVRGVLLNDAAAAIDWARATLDRLEAEATEVTADLDALSAAITDGLAPRSQLPTDETAESAGADAAMAGGGHGLPLDLEAEGFARLSDEYFQTYGLAPPAVSWRTGFTLGEVQAGHAVDRRDAEGHDLTAQLVEALRTGTDHVVMGPPGSGKSTICQSVACAWFDRGLGPVLYRERGAGDRFDSTALLEAYLRETDGHALIVVEDAVREEAAAIFAIMHHLDADPSVTFLLDARTHEWRDPDAFAIDARLDAYRRTAVEAVTVPPLDERECERFVAHFTSLLDDDIDLSGAELFELVEAGTSTVRAGGAAPTEGLPAGEALVAQHYLARSYDPPVGGDGASSTALEDAVRETYRSLQAADVAIAADLGVLVAVLTAAGVPVAREYLYGAADTSAYSDVAEAISILEGSLLFAGNRSSERSAYRTRHETWALRFLEAVLSVEPPGRSRARVGDRLSQLLALADDPDRRTGIERHLDGRTPHLHRIEADPGGWADELVERAFGIGQTDANLAPMFGETADEPIELPAACSPWTRLQLAYWRGQMNRTYGDLERAEREFSTLGEVAMDLDLETDRVAGTRLEPPTPAFANGRDSTNEAIDVHRTRWYATSRTGLGGVARDRGEYETAASYHEEALAGFREIGDQAGEALALKNLGTSAFYRSDYAMAREYFERSLDIASELDARQIEADCLMTLGAVATKQSNYDEGREYFERSLAIARDIGDRQGEASRRNNLGVIAFHRGAYDRAREYCEGSASIEGELGDRQGQANSLNNLGQVARRQGAYDRAREYFMESLEIRRDIGDRQGEATSVVNLGAIALDTGDRDRAREYFDQAHEIYERVDATHGIAEVAYERGRLALAADRPSAARDHAQQALELFESLALDVWTARCRRLLGRVANATGDPDRAREYWQAAFESFHAVDAAPDALETLEDLVETCREQGAKDAAREWVRRARGVLADAPEATATQHRDWIDHHAEALDVD